MQRIKLLPTPEIIRQKSHGYREQKRRAMMGRFLAELLRIHKGLSSDQESRGHEENWPGIS